MGKNNKWKHSIVDNLGQAGCRGKGCDRGATFTMIRERSDGSDDPKAYKRPYCETHARAWAVSKHISFPGDDVNAPETVEEAPAVPSFEGATIIADKPEPSPDVEFVDATFTVNVDTFRRALEITARTADKRSTMRVLARVLLKCTSTELVLASSNIRNTVITRVPIRAPSYLSMCVEPWSLLKWLKKKPAVDLVVRYDGEKEKATFTINDSTIEVNTITEEEFPTLPSKIEDPTVRLHYQPAELVNAFERVAPSISDDETRPYLNGLCLDANSMPGRVMLVATDGHRMSVLETHPEAYPIDGYNVDEFRALLPQMSVKELIWLAKKADDNHSIHLQFTNGSMVRVRFDRAGIPVEFWIRKTDSEFPPWRSVMPKHETSATGGVVTFNAAELLDAATEAATMTSDRHRAIHLVPIYTTDLTQIDIVVDNPEKGRFERSLEVTAAPHNENEEIRVNRIGFNADYVITAVKTAVNIRPDKLNGESVRVHIGLPLEGAIIEAGNDLRVVVMPVRI